MTDRPTAEQLAELKADLERMTGPELMYAALTDPRLDWLDEPAEQGKPWRYWRNEPAVRSVPWRGGPPLDPAAEAGYRAEQADYCD